jgi:hypothetical protein
MSSHATEGARPSTAPGGEAPTAAQAAPAPAQAGAATAGPAEGSPATAAPGEGVTDTAAGQGVTDTAGAGQGVTDTAGASEGVTDTAGASEGVTGTAVAAGGAPEPEGDLGEADVGEGGVGEGIEVAETGSRPVSVLAVVALVTGLVALVPIAVASGVAALAGIRRTGCRGHGMAMAGLFLSAAWVVVGAAIGTVGVLTHGFHKPVTVKYQESAVFKLREGDCVDSPNGTLVSVLPCSTPHEAEVFATFALPGSRWPGTAAIASEASSGCVSRLTAYLNPQLAISLSQSFVYPNQVAWTGGTRTVICEVRASSGELTGSVHGATSAGVLAHA